ncbi:MAG TPA: CopD family protein, partial [Thermomicrobiales bacterium]|nr:CopD family protein [Thermomicrobiales bacterium]
LALLGLAVALAIWPIWVFVLQPAASDESARAALARRARRFAAGALVAAVVGNLAALLVQAAALGSADYPGAAWTTVSDTRYGRLWWLRIGLLAAYALLLRFADWERPGRRALLAGLGLIVAAAMPIPYSLNTHAAAEQTGTTVAVATDALHLLGAAMWAGGLIVLLAVLLPALPGRPMARRDVVARALPRFSATALVAWAVLGASGLYSAWLQVGSLDGLRETTYGQTLLVKLALLVPLLGLGAVNLLVASPRIEHAANAPRSLQWSRRLTWTIGAEVALVTIVLLVVGRLTGLEPARAELAAQHPPGLVLPVALDADDATRPATLTIAPGAAGPNQYRLEVAGAPLPDGSEAVLRFSLPTVGIGTKEVALKHDGGSTFTGSGSELAIAGTWTVETIVRKIGAFSWDATQTMALGSTPSAAAAPPAWVFGNLGLPALALLLLGFVASVLAWLQPRHRGGWSGAAVAALAVGAIVLLQARVLPAAPVLAGPAV